MSSLHASQLSAQQYFSTKNMYIQLFSIVQLFATPWTVAHQAPLFMEFSQQE